MTDHVTMMMTSLQLMPQLKTTSTRKLYIEALLQWAEWLTLCNLVVKLVQYTLFDLLDSVCLDSMTVASTPCILLNSIQKVNSVI
jgi:hypothetical protein